MRETYNVPASLDDALAELGGIGELLTATEWRRAAIVAAFVRLDNGHGGRETDKNIRFFSARSFADLGVAGLRTHPTVVKYVEAWLSANAGKYPRPGKPVKLPIIDFPPTGNDSGRGLGRLSDPEHAREAVRIVAETHGTDAVIDAVPDQADLEQKVIDRSIDRMPFGGKKPKVPGEDYQASTANEIRSLCANLLATLGVLEVKLAEARVDELEDVAPSLATVAHRTAEVLAPFVPSADTVEQFLKDRSV